MNEVSAGNADWAGTLRGGRREPRVCQATIFDIEASQAGQNGSIIHGDSVSILPGFFILPFLG